MSFQSVVAYSGHYALHVLSQGQDRQCRPDLHRVFYGERTKFSHHVLSATFAYTPHLVVRLFAMAGLSLWVIGVCIDYIAASNMDD